MYPDCPSALRPVTHTSENIPIPTPPVSERENESSSAKSLASQSSASISTVTDEEPHSSRVSDVPQLLNQKDLNDLVRDLALTKEKSELLASRLKQWNMLQKGVERIYFRSRHTRLQDYFSVRDNVCYCDNIDGLFEALGSKHAPEEWRLFIDSSKAILKAVLLNNGYKKPSVPLVHATSLKETYDIMELILRLINSSSYK